MRQLTTIFLAFLNLVLLAGWAIGCQASPYPTDIAEIVKRDKLRVAIYSKDILPFIGQNEKGELIGYDVELAKLLAKKLGVKIEFNRKAKTFDEIIELVNQRHVDLAIGILTPTPERAKKVRFTKPYLLLNQGLLYNRLAAAKYKITDPANQPNKLQGLKIGILKSSSYVNYARHDFPAANFIPYDTLVDAMDDVKQGKLFACFSYLTDLEQWLNSKADAGLYTGISKLNNKLSPIAIAASWETPNLLNWVDMALLLMDLERENMGLRKQYLANSNVRFNNDTDYA